MLRLLFLFLVLFAGATGADGKPRVVASIEPLSMLAREVLAEAATVETLLRPAQNLHQASLTPGQARAIREADIFIWLGAAAEPQLAPLVKRREGGSLALLEQPGVVRIGGSAHGPEDHGHQEKSLDPHLWLLPDNMRQLAGPLAEAVPGATAEEFLASLAAAEKTVGARLDSWRDEPWLSHHDPWAYFYRAFPLREPLVINRALMGGLSSRRMLELSERMEAMSLRCVIAEPEARRALLAKLCGEGCRIVEIDPLGRDQTGRTYSEFITGVGERFGRCLGR